MSRRQISHILYLSTFPPRECGIATFTKDLTAAMNKRFNPALKSNVIAVNHESTDIYNYPKEVSHQIAANNIEEYLIAAKKISADDSVKLIHIQHEFGIFGGEYGNYLIPFLQTIEKPVVITFHAVLPAINKHQENTVRFLLKKAKAVIVMNKFSKEILEKEYDGEKSKIFVIPHGIPQVTNSDPEKEKQNLRFSGKTVLSTFGLLSRGKGIEYAIRALPEIIKQFPNTIYLILGITHPLVRKYEGESYRNFLKQEVLRLGLKNHVKFYNKYLTLKEIISYLTATDVYLHPSFDQEQSVSGTLSYALGCGRPIIAAVSSYARSIITPETGILVEPKNHQVIQEALITLLKDVQLRKQIGRAAYTETRHMTWSNVALAHFNLYQKYANLVEKEEKLPALTLKHLKTLTDNFGVIQFAKNTKPDIRYGYSLDDNARAAIVTAQYWDRSKNKQILNLLKTYLNFISFAQRPDGSFVNSITSKKIINDTELSQDTQGRTIWALGYLATLSSLPYQLKSRAQTLLKKALPVIKKINSPRAMAFAIIGLYLYNESYPHSALKKILKRLADNQLALFKKRASRNWQWFENYLTYSNSKLTESLFCAYLATGEKKYLETAEKSLRFLINITFRKGYFFSIGQNGWYFKDGKRAYFDQQPEETSSMVQTLVFAYKTTKKALYKKRAFQAFHWFLGKNYLKQTVYDESTGGCYDGIGRYSLNINQGAESTISYLLARLSLEEII